MWTSDNWKDYQLLDCGGGRRLERWGDRTLVRPDPQAVWPPADSRGWESADAVYHRSPSGGGEWEIRSLPESWTVRCDDLTFCVKPMSFKHTGVFPEQAANWDFIRSQLKHRKSAQVLNLFAYTGGATLAAASAGAEVCHVDAAKGMVSWAKENALLSGLDKAPVRYIVDDCVKFIRREQTRGRKYDGIIMDPPSYGRGPSGEIWKFEDQIAELIAACERLLSDDPLFFIVSSYTAGVSPSVPAYILGNTVVRRFGGTVETGDLGLRCERTNLLLPCGSTTRWTV